MSAKCRCAGAVMLLLLAGISGRAQTPREIAFESATGSKSAMTGAGDMAHASTVEAAPAVQAYAPDAWVYQQPDRCCPQGFSGPIGTEIYFRGGASFPLAAADFKKAVRTGWEVMGGGRTLFFTPDAMRAWIVDIGVSYTINNGHPSRSFLYESGAAVTLRELHRTALSLGFGHDWFVSGPGATGSHLGGNWRYGIDGGARWGTAHIDLNPVANPGGYARTQDTYGAAFAAVHLDWERPMGAWTLLLGVRGEWSYSFMDLLPNQSTRLQDINVLGTVGVRW